MFCANSAILGTLRARASACAIALALAATSAGAQVGPPHSSVASNLTGDLAPTAAAQGESNGYVIGPGDTLEVYVWNNPNLTVTIPVRPDGKISTPLVENMVAVGKTPSQLARDIETVLAVYIRSPKVNIIVTQPIGALTEVKVIGQVVKPGAFPYHEGIRVLDVVLDAGGLTEYAAGNRAKIIRKEDGKEEVIRVRLDRLMNKGDISQNVPLMPNDVIVVPESLF